MKQHMGRFAEYRQRAQEIAARLHRIDRITVVPKVPATLMMHLHIAVDAHQLNQANHKLAADTNVMLFGKASECGEGLSKVELSIGSACQSMSNDEIESLFRTLLAGL